MSSRTTRTLIVAATLFNGALAGGNINGLLVAMPAWRRVGPVAWATFSRKADLGNGLILYPLEAFGGAIFSIAAAFSLRRQRNVRGSAALPINLAALLTIGGLLVTSQAAPKMLSLRTLNDDTDALQRAFDGFAFWSGVRGVMQVLAWVANLWSLIAVRTP
jgi:hypothetical protein